VQPGNALSSAAIVSSGNIGRVSVKGNVSSSEIKSGFHYPSFAAGLEGTRAPSLIKNATFRGDLVNGVVSATYRPSRASGSTTGTYGNPNDVKGPGLIQGSLGQNNRIYNTGSVTPLLNTGTGFRARKKIGYLPPPSLPTRIDSVQVR
jgi:hypothetical protein